MVSVAAFLCGCGGAAGSASIRTPSASAPSPKASATPTTASDGSASQAPVPLTLADLVSHPLTTQGLGPLAIGMTPAQASAAVGRPIKPDYTAFPDCSEISPFDPPDSPNTTFTLTFEKDRLVDISTTSPSIHTPSGIRVGSTSNAVRSALGPGLHEEQRGYPPGNHKLVFVSREEPGQQVWFSTDGKRVVGIETGQVPFVGYLFDEVCD
jgi:hypothetical protein